MAAQSGVWFFDERPIDDACRELEQGLWPISPDGVSTFADAGIAMAFGANHVWTGEASAQQPRRSASGLVITWDGRLDNRDDLALRLDGRLPRDVSDVDLALAVFERWGIDGLRSLVGDWSLAIWDSHKRTLHLARDYMGVRPLYYHLTDRAVMWSTSLGDLAIRAGRVDDLDEAFVARFMALQFSTDVTPYKGIRGVPTASCVSISADGVETRRRFWRLEAGSIRYRDSGQYEEHLRALWIEAVGSRLRTEGTVWAELSGGLDSSSVVCMADAMIKAEQVAASGLRTISHVTLQSPEGDERRFVAAVDERIGGRTDVLGVEEHAEAGDGEWAWVSPLAPRGVKAASIRHVQQSGGRLVSSGRMGDATMGCVTDNSVAVLDDLWNWQPVTALSSLRQWSRARRVPFAEVAWNVACEALRARRETGLQALPLPRGFRRAAVGVLSPALLSQLDADIVGPAVGSVLRSGQIQQARRMLFYSVPARLETWSERGSVLFTYPFAHRPLVDFMLAVPGVEIAAPGQPRSLMRRAFAGLIPDKILRRVSKGHYPPAALRAARLRIASLPPVEQLEAVRRGWLDPERLRTAIRMLADGHGDTGTEVQLSLLLEHWLVSRHRRGPAVIPKGKEVNTNDVCIA